MFIPALVLHFLIRLRFPRNSSIADILRRRYGAPVLSLHRSVERLDYRVRKVRCDIDFLICCQQQDLIPNFLHFKLYDRLLHHTRLYRNCQRQFLNRELSCKQRLLRNLKARLDRLTTELEGEVSWIDFNHLKCLIDRTNHMSIARVKFVQRNKLRNLGYVSDDGIPYEKVIFNYSNKVLSSVEKKVLSKGLKYVLSHCKPNFIDHFCTFEVFFKNLLKHEFYDVNNKGFDYFRSSLKHLAFSSFYDNNYHFSHNITKEEYEALKKLSKDKSIVIMRPDKGNGVVLLNTCDYKNKVYEILNDSSKFERIHDDALLTMLNKEEKINVFLRNMKSEGVISQELYSELFVSGSKPGILYGLPKVHKDGCPVRPILSAIGTFNYKLSKFLVPLLAPITINEYTVKDSFSFSKEVCDLNFENCCIASFDVKSLFTNIPLNETIDICTDNLFGDSDKVLNFGKRQFHKLLSLAASECYFVFNEELYRQKDGVAMGNPLGPTLANAFLAHHEVKWLDECPENFKPLVYRRYVDDTFLVFKSPSHVPLFLGYINSKHQNIEFTSEVESDDKLPFLDVLVKHEGSGFTTSVYRKPTFTGLTTKFTSFIPDQYKRNLVSTLTTRAFYICSNYLNIHKEFSFLKRMLFSNGFSVNFVDTYLGKQLRNLIQPKSPRSTASKAVVYFSIPYMGKRSFNFKNNLTRLLREFYPQLMIRVIFKQGFSIQSLFRFKDRIPENLQSSAVYQYKCRCCNAMYVGKTKRQIRVRQFEHLGRSVRTNRPLGKPPFSAIRQHSENTDHPMYLDSFSVLSTRSKDVELSIIESLYIVKDKPSLCNGRSVELLCF